jgi:hypothetical protein
VTADLSRLLISDESRKVCAAAKAIGRWRMGANASLLPAVPQVLIGLLVSRVVFRRPAAFDFVVDCLVQFIEGNGGRLELELEQELLRGLEYIAGETAAVRLRERFLEGEIDRGAVAEGLHARNWAAILARKMTVAISARGDPVPAVLRRWEEICRSDVLPEIRRAWDGVR